MGMTAAVYFQSVRSYYGFYLHSELHKAEPALCDGRSMCCTLWHFGVLTCVCVCVCLQTAPAPALSAPLVPTCLDSAFIQIFLILILPRSLLPTFFTFSLHHRLLFQGAPRYPSPALPSLPSSPPPFLLTDLIAAIPFHCLPLLPPPLLLFLFSDSPGKTCWLSQPRTHTMIPGLLSGQHWTQPHQFHPFKGMKGQRLKESRENDFLYSYGECSSNTKVGLLQGGRVEAQDNGKRSVQRAINIHWRFAKGWVRSCSET